MKHNTDFIQHFMSRLEFPGEAVKLFTEVLEKFDGNSLYAKIYDTLIDKYEYHQTRIEKKLTRPLDVLAKLMGYNKYTVHEVFLLSLAEKLWNQYILMGLGEDRYWETMADMKYKLLECMECEGVPGTVSFGWFDGYFRFDKASYGRFQYELCTYDFDEPFTMKNGHVVRKGDRLVGFHIPSSGVPLTDEVRFDSYRKAYESVKELFPDGKVIFACSSWLLYPKHREFLPEHMNIRRFMDDFELVEWSEDKNGFYDIWRIFGRDAKLPYDKLPKDTTLKKAYAEWLSAGNKGGHGVGLFMFDGEKII